MVVGAQLLEHGANTSVAGVATNTRTTCWVVNGKARRRNQTSLEGVKGKLLASRPSKTNALLGQMDQGLCNFTKTFDKASVIVTKA